MHKISLIGLLIALVPSICMGESMRVNRLIQEKQRKMAELEKCMGSTKGLKIAGISTLGLTAVGVVGNVAEAKKINEYDDKIESTEKSIEKTQKQIDETRADLAKQKAEAEEKKRKEELKKNCEQSKGTWKDEDYCECPCATKLNSYGRCELPVNLVPTTVNGRNILLNTTNNTYVDPTTGNVVGVVGGTVTGLSAGSISGTDSGTSAGGTDGDAANQVDNTPDTLAGAVECGVTCDSSYDNKTIACEGSDSNSKMDLYICKNNVWENKGSIINCNSDLTNPGSGYKKIGKWKTGFVFASNKTEISGSSPKAWQITSYCEACDKGKYKKNGSCVTDNRCTAEDGTKHEEGTAGAAPCKDIANSKECTWTCSKGNWAEPKLSKCNDDYTKSSNTCVKNKKTLVELIGGENRLPIAPTQYAARDGNSQCFINGTTSNTPGSCSSLSRNQWWASFSYGYVMGTGSCPDSSSSGSYSKCVCTLSRFVGTDGVVHNFRAGWFLSGNTYQQPGCSNSCAVWCASWVNSNETRFRQTMFKEFGTEQ